MEGNLNKLLIEVRPDDKFFNSLEIQKLFYADLTKWKLIITTYYYHELIIAGNWITNGAID